MASCFRGFAHRIKHKGLSNMLDFFSQNCSNCVWLVVLIVALIPTLESKIAIPFGMSQQIFGDSALSPIVSCVLAFVGSLLPAIFIILLFRKIKQKTTGFVNDKLLNIANRKIKNHFEKFNQRNTTLKKCVYLAGFVAIPLPLTGVYTGSLIAGLSNLKLWQGLLSIVVGEFFACVGITILCALFENSAFYIFLMGLAIVNVICCVNFVIWLISKIKNRKT